MSDPGIILLSDSEIVEEIESQARRRGWESAKALVDAFHAGKMECPGECLYILSLGAMLAKGHSLHVDL